LKVGGEKFRIQMDKFIPAASFDWFRWRTKNGTNISEFPIATQSWEDLTAPSESEPD